MRKGGKDKGREAGRKGRREEKKEKKACIFFPRVNANPFELKPILFSTPSYEGIALPVMKE